MSDFSTDKDTLIQELLQERDEFFFELSRLRKIDNGALEKALTRTIHKLSITMINYLVKAGVLNKIDLKIIHYSLHQFSSRLPVFICI